MCKAFWLEKMQGAKNWYVPVGQPRVVNMKQVLDTNLDMCVHGENAQLPRNLSKYVRNNAISQGAMKLSDEDYEMMKVEIERRDEINFEYEQEKRTEDSDDEVMDSNDYESDPEYA